tara:strand:- start:494 stop:865 length:372 start_codon:yes stop_codon:yes gene_type:complete
MFSLNKKKYTCLICHEDLRRPCFLNLNCNCDYNCHFKCFNKWYLTKPECIICHTPTYGKPYWRKLRKRKIRRERTPPRTVILTTNEIERRLARLPDDNENERKTLKFIFILMVLFWFIYNHLK